jgi:hypothetical protein
MEILIDKLNNFLRSSSLLYLINVLLSKFKPFIMLIRVNTIIRIIMFKNGPYKSTKYLFPNLKFKGIKDILILVRT